jgi:hypothetical protein
LESPGFVHAVSDKDRGCLVATLMLSKVAIKHRMTEVADDAFSVITILTESIFPDSFSGCSVKVSAIIVVINPIYSFHDSITIS